MAHWCSPELPGVIQGWSSVVQGWSSVVQGSLVSFRAHWCSLGLTGVIQGSLV